MQVEVVRVEIEGAVGRERERGAAQLNRIDAQQQVVHDRVADEHQLQHVRRLDLASAHSSPSSASMAVRTAAVISTSPPGFIIE